MSKKIQIEQETESKIGKLFRTNYKDRKFIKGAGFICILILTVSITGIPFLTSFKEMKSDPEILFAYVFGIILLVFAVFLLCMYKLIKFLFEKQSGEIINKLEEAFGKMDEDVSKIIRTSKFIFNKRKELWENSHDGIEVNNLLRSLVYPASSLYSVTAFVIGKQGNKATDMLFMKSKDTTGREQEYDVLGQRMPINSVPHNYVKSLIKKYIHNYDESDIQFSHIFHKIDEEFKEGQIDRFTKQVPSPYRIQEESNSQSDGSPFFLDYIYVLEVQKKGPNGVLQSDLKAEWVNLKEVKQICCNGASPTRYGGESREDKMYIKFESQLRYADKIVDAYEKNSK